MNFNKMMCNISRLMPKTLGCAFLQKTNGILIPKMCLLSRAQVRTMIVPKQRLIECNTQVSIHIRHIHVTSPSKAVPPIIIVLLRPLLKLGAIIFGRTIRKRWQKLSQEERDKIMKKVRSRLTQISFAGTLLLGLGGFYYIEHIIEEPITKRKRFIIYNDEQMLQIAQLEYESQVNDLKRDIVPPSHPVYQRIARVANRILAANKDLPQIRSKHWAITVVDRPEVTNAFVLPHGKIFVFTGMLNVCTNDDQLAIVLSHEISHAILSHMAESLSQVLVVEMILFIPLIVFWAVFSDVGALFSQWLSSKLADIMIHLPFSRSIEKEADSVGLQLAARACYDVREAPVFWAKMNIVNQSPIPVEWLSTHPSHESRQQELEELLPKALKLHAANHCPALYPLTPTQTFYSYLHRKL